MYTVSYLTSEGIKKKFISHYQTIVFNYVIQNPENLSIIYITENCGWNPITASLDTVNYVIKNNEIFRIDDLNYPVYSGNDECNKILSQKKDCTESIKYIKKIYALGSTIYDFSEDKIHRFNVREVSELILKINNDSFIIFFRHYISELVKQNQKTYEKNCLCLYKLDENEPFNCSIAKLYDIYILVQDRIKTEIEWVSQYQPKIIY